MKRTYCAMLEPGQFVNDLFMIVDLIERIGRRGDPYLVLALGDRSGRIRGYVGGPVGPLMSGEVVHVRGRTRRAGAETEIIVSSIEPADPLGYHLSDFTPVAPESRTTYLNRLSDLVDEISEPSYRALVLGFLEDRSFLDRFCRAPASLAHHHAYEGGLLQHTVEVMEAVIQVFPTLTPPVDPSLLLTAAFLHDIGKVDTYSETYPYQLTPLGRWVGHELLGLRLLLPAMDALPSLTSEATGRLLATLYRTPRPDGQRSRSPVTPEGRVVAALDGLTVGLCHAKGEAYEASLPLAGGLRVL